ncbi:family 2 encapsulin nanocompartment cargo protein terpene cyclase [Actinoplanes regularis]|uniref:Terpene synthase n=1 Tax=Actinoplanes regularis TaxID=52697 RepID=A0A238W7X0_9ACTN|nr:family 2 encapsulin nanocompartment cargo protein terpene cyclase [Actinoplanes regularis]GIE85179.1 terpene synthase [Actinoplanes regularis]SNR42608.1 2-methylisoborneol synthase [Actinoplanes regularis]
MLRTVDLGREILTDFTSAPSGHLSALFVPKIDLAPSGLGTSAARAFSPRPEKPAEPRLFCPGPLRDDRALGEQVNEAVVSWAEQVGIYPGRLDKLRAANFGRFMMLAHPATSDPDRLLAATKCLVAEWAADDYYVDEVSLGADPMVVGSRLANLHAVIDPAALPGRYLADLEGYHRLQPISVAFRSALEHLARYTTVTQMARFQHQMAILFVAWAQEADWHANRRTPPVWEYLVQRHLNDYLPPMILIDVLGGYELPPEEFYHPRVREAFTAAGDAAVLVNDLYSGPNESENDHNLPSVLVANERLTQREAVLRTVEIHNELMETFVTLAASLSATGSPTLRRFLVDTWAWLGGSREWHATSGRYHDTKEEKS